MPPCKGLKHTLISRRGRFPSGADLVLESSSHEVLKVPLVLVKDTETFSVVSWLVSLKTNRQPEAELPAANEQLRETAVE